MSRQKPNFTSISAARKVLLECGYRADDDSHPRLHALQRGILDGLSAPLLLFTVNSQPLTDCGRDSVRNAWVRTGRLLGKAERDWHKRWYERARAPEERPKEFAE